MSSVLSPDQVARYRRDGYLVVSGLFTAAEAAGMIDHFMALRAQGARPGDFGGVSEKDANQRYPRFINMHGWDDLSRQWASRPDLLAATAQLLDDQPVLNQTMLYFKPPGGMGQGLHQDQQYITKEPLIGVWVALDRTDEANGRMVVVPGSHKLGMLEVKPADLSTSFTPGQTVVPEGYQEVGLDMAPGDTLFFDGKTVHGSYPNRTTDRFRRSFIVHFQGKHAKAFDPKRGTHMTHLHTPPPQPA